MASPQTLRKASITSQQLERRYNLIYSSLSLQPLNIARVARWYGSQDDHVKDALEKAEPLTWLKHLDKRAKKSKRLPWHLSALIMEQHLQAQVLHRSVIETIPDHLLSQHDSAKSPAYMPRDNLQSSDIPSKSHQSDILLPADSHATSEAEAGMSGSSDTTSAASLPTSAVASSRSQVKASGDILKYISGSQGPYGPNSLSERSNIFAKSSSISQEGNISKDHGSIAPQPEIKIIAAQDFSDNNSDSLNFAASPSGRSDLSGRSPIHSIYSIPLSSNPRSVRVSLPVKISTTNSQSKRANEELASQKYDAKAA